jgi:hypothetical protein
MAAIRERSVQSSHCALSRRRARAGVLRTVVDLHGAHLALARNIQ